MAANMSIPADEKMPIDATMRYILLAAQDALTDFTSSTKNWLLSYFITTVVCLFMDLSNFFIQVKHFAKYSSAFADLTLIALASLFLFIDWFYIMWVVTLTYKFPPFLATAIIKSFFGMIETIHTKLGSYIASSKERYNVQYQL